MVIHQISHLMPVSLLKNIDQLMVFEQDDLVYLKTSNKIQFLIKSSEFSFYQDIQIHNEILHLPFEFLIVQEH